MGQKKYDEGIAAFKRNVELYPESANVYDSLGEGLEAARQYVAAIENFKKAIDIAARTNDGSLPQFKAHLARVTTEAQKNGEKTPAARPAQ